MAELQVLANVTPRQIENTADKQLSAQEVTKGVVESENAALKRCAETSSPDKLARQAYDRMYHTHNRG